MTMGVMKAKAREMGTIPSDPAGMTWISNQRQPVRRPGIEFAPLSGAVQLLQ
jgi:hypothetical protein